MAADAARTVLDGGLADLASLFSAKDCNGRKSPDPDNEDRRVSLSYT